MPEPLTALEVDAITRYLQETIEDAEAKRKKQQDNFRKQFNTEELVRCDGGISCNLEISETVGFRDGVDFVLQILESRELP